MTLNCNMLSIQSTKNMKVMSNTKLFSYLLPLMCYFGTWNCLISIFRYYAFTNITNHNGNRIV